jgi:hypothetical protein
VHRHENRNENDVLASSEQIVDEKLQTTLLCNAMEKKICIVDVPVDEHM